MVIRCNVTAACTQPAVTQTTAACAGCAVFDTEINTRVNVLRAEHDHCLRALAVVGERGDPRDPVIAQALAQGQQRAAQAQANLDALAASYETAGAAHTHPVYACTAHAKNL